MTDELAERVVRTRMAEACAAQIQNGLGWTVDAAIRAALRAIDDLERADVL